MAKFFFYTDLDKIENQNGPNNVPPQAHEKVAFGPVSDQSFQLTNLHYPNSSTTDNPPAAYAICEGTIFCVEVPGSINLNESLPLTHPANQPKLVNIILKPLEQPKNSPHVKYYIYRSILKASLVDDNSNVITDIHPYSNKLTKKINGQGTESPKSGKTLGLPYSSTSVTVHETFIDDIFSAGLNLQNVKAGESIGYFPGFNSFLSTNHYLRYFGLEIMLDSMGFNPKLKDVTQVMYAEGQFANSNIKTFDGPSFIENKKNKEYILNFMDPAAFYGNFYESIVNKSDDDLFVNGETDALKADDVYNKILIGNSNVTNNASNGNIEVGHERRRLFRNSNRIYIDIRNEFNFSLNYFDEYSTGNTPEDLKVKFSHENSTGYKKISSVTKDRNDYPVIIFEKDDLGLTDTPHEYMVLGPTHSNSGERDMTTLPGITNPVNKNYQRFKAIRLKLKLQKNSPTAFYTAYINSGIARQQINDNSNSKFKDLNTYSSDTEDADFENYTSPLLIDLYRYENPLSETTQIDWKVNHCIAKHIKITIIKHESDLQKALTSSITSLKSLEYLDNIFLPFEQIINFPDSTKIMAKVYEEAAYVNNMKIDGTDFMADIGIVKDINGDIILFANANSFFKDPLISSQSVEVQSSRIKITSEFFKNNIDQSSSGSFLHKLASIDKLYWESHSFQDNGKTILLENITDKEEVSFRFNSPVKGFAAIKITAADFATLKGFHVSNFGPQGNGFKEFLAFKFTPSTLSTEYSKYEIVIRGFEIVSDSLQIKEVSTGIYIYFYYPGVALDQKNLTALPGTNPYEIIDLPPVLNLFEGAQEIHSNVYFLKGVNVSNEEFLNCIEYFKTDINKVWSTETNKGIRDAALSVNGVQQSFVSKKITAENVKPFLATPYQLQNLKNKDVVVSIIKEDKRSSAFGRTIMLYFNDASTVQSLTDALSHAAAHEFGHIMGLSDRYCYMGVVYKDSDNLLKVVQKSAVSVPLYFPPKVDDDSPDIDDEYSTNYRWWFNLLSTSNEVSDPDSIEPFKGESTFDTDFRNLYNPTSDTITLFITSKQWGIIRNYSQEVTYAGDKNLFFKNADYFNPTSPDLITFKGSFLGQPVPLDAVTPTGEPIPLGPITTDDTLDAPAPGIPDMENRIFPASPDLPLYKGQFKDVSIDFIDIANDILKLQDIQTGGLELSKKRLNENNFSDASDGNLRDSNDRYILPNSGIGKGDPIGIDLWNSEIFQNQTFNHNKITYDIHTNRIAIIIAIGTASGPG